MVEHGPSCVPGHEIVVRVTRVGPAVRKHAVGDLVGVGCMIDSCGQCEACQCGVQAGHKVGIIGIIGMGGLDHMAAKLARAMGAEVTMFTTTRDKIDEARKLGVDAVMEDDKDGLKEEMAE